MGSKYSSQSISGYNSTPPSDDGTVSESNKVKWSTIKNKLTDPPKVLAEAVNTAINTALDYGPISVVSAAVTLGASHNNQFIELSGASTPTLGDASTLGAGWFADVKNIGSSVITVARTTSTDTINTVTADATMNSLDYIRFVVNAAASGFTTGPSIKKATAAQVTAGTVSDAFVTPETLKGHISTGTWTPTLQDASFSDAESQTYGTQTGVYVRIGDQVFIQGYLAVNSLGTLSGASSAYMAGLPFTSINSGVQAGSISMGRALSVNLAASTTIAGYVDVNVDYVNLTVMDTGAGTTPLTITEFSAGGQIVFSGQYTAA